MSFSVATWNVNSIRPRLPHLLTWLKTAQPDIALLQETKLVNESFPTMEIEELGYHLAFHGQKSYNGVAILSKLPLEDIVTRLPGDDADEQARYIEAVASSSHGAVRIASVYVPNGQAIDSEKFPYKLKFLERLRDHFATLQFYGEFFVAGGDYNVSPYPLDVHDPASMEGRICFHPEERARMRALHHLGLYDAFRIAHPASRQFTWWDYRENARVANLGLRIDHLMLSAPAVDRLQSVAIDEYTRDWDKPSDHAPVIARFAGIG